jgi:hypothetical protein
MSTTSTAATAEITNPLDEWTLNYEVEEPHHPTTTVKTDDIRNKLAEASSSYRTSLSTSDLTLALARFLQTAQSTQPPVLANTLPIIVHPAQFPISFATVPTHVEPQAAVFLARLPWSLVHPLLTAVSSWVPTAPVTAARVRLISQSVDDETWDEAVVELRLQSDTDTALALWDDFSQHLDAVRLALSPEDRDAVDRNISFHLQWGDDPEL